MNPKLSNKRKELGLLQDCIERLKTLQLGLNGYGDPAIELIIFNLERTKDLINGLYK